MDRFKKINDEFGHLFGDQVLKAIARRVSDGCKPPYQGFRIGGEEIAVLLPGTNMAVARQFAESLRRGVEKLTVMDRKTGQRFNSVTASFGVAAFTAGDGYAEIMRRADDQLYHAKDLGRNRVMPMSL